MYIKFVYSIGRGAMQLHEQNEIVEVDGDPDSRGLPSHRQLAEAERKFWTWFLSSKPGCYLILYVAGPADGTKWKYSEYRAHLPAG